MRRRNDFRAPPLRAATASRQGQRRLPGYTRGRCGDAWRLAAFGFGTHVPAFGGTLRFDSGLFQPRFVRDVFARANASHAVRTDETFYRRWVRVERPQT